MTTTTTASPSAATASGRVRSWLFHEESQGDPLGPLARSQDDGAAHPWWKVMCLTGVDYFSTLGYQPGIAALAAGALAPLATIVLVALTLFGALPVYRRVARESPHGQGSIAMLERLLPLWRGKLVVLALLGFAATDFVITITLSSADAAAHVTENPHVPAILGDEQLAITVALVTLLGGVFLKGFREAVGLAVVIVVAYLTLNAVVIAASVWQVMQNPHLVRDWTGRLTTMHGGDPAMLVLLSMVVFPKLALGLSGFETGVAVMSHVRGDPDDHAALPSGRIRNTQHLLTTAALVMSCYLLASTFVTTWLIPPHELAEGGTAHGRALAYLAHRYLGEGFGTVYDVTTIAILWFAGASAMAGLLNLIPRYLPRYGMAPEWARARRPLVLVLSGIALLVTWAFDADVDAQGGAYATGVLVLITSAAVAVTLSALRARQHRQVLAFGAITAALLYTLSLNVVERPDGVKIASAFAAAIVVASVVSRLRRAYELRAVDIVLDDMAQLFIRDVAHRTIRFVAKEPGTRDRSEYRQKIDQIVDDHDLTDAASIIFVEITVTDPSDFASTLQVRGEVMHGRFRVITMASPSIANAMAAFLLRVQELTGKRPHVYFEWSEGGPGWHLARFFLFGAGEIGPVTREILRRAVRDPRRRPHVHAG